GTPYDTPPTTPSRHARAPPCTHGILTRRRHVRGDATSIPLTSAASGYVCLVDDAAESFVVGVVVAPDDVPADHAGLLLVTGVVGAVEGEVAQRGELGFDAVQPGGVGRGVGDLGVVRRRPPPGALVFAGGQVG